MKVIKLSRKTGVDLDSLWLMFVLSLLKVYPAEIGASQFSRAPARLQRDSAGSLPAHGGRLWKLCYSEVL